jgi:CheY-like chemotaxis protein
MRGNDSGRSHLGLSSAHKMHPDIIVLDLIMPAGGGFSVLERLEMSLDTASIPIIVTSASTDQVLIQKITDKGIDIVKKPYVVEDLIAVILNKLDVSVPT